MINTDPVVTALRAETFKSERFRPSQVDLSQPFVESEESIADDRDETTVHDEWHMEIAPLTPRFPAESNVTAIDATGLVLGVIPDGFVAALRASLVTKTAENKHTLEHYGPYLMAVTTTNIDAMYQTMYRTVYGDTPPSSQSPKLENILDRVRNLLERYLQMQVATRSNRTMILLDGSLIGGTVANPSHYVRRIIDKSAENQNSLAAISKSTGLILERSHRSILSLLEGVSGPCYVGDIRNHIRQQRERYLGGIYVAKFTPVGEPFRIDLPEDAPTSQADLLNAVAGLAGDYGYPEELKLAHMTCVFSAIEILELQAAAVAFHNLIMEEEVDVRQKIFPF
ncbi:MAG TPA: DNA double-strand break repair nuclease NurA [Candidatus Bathyarchaeia archaeon]|nr:DNA double-strand break repair nuclease NurA [Candidatus Bathyarchaeia archaeon]